MGIDFGTRPQSEAFVVADPSPLAGVLAENGILWFEVWSWSVPTVAVMALVLVVGATVSALVGLGRIFSLQQPIPVGDEDEVATVFGSRIRYRQAEGAGPPIILVHGYNRSIDHWDRIVKRLRGHHIVSLDLVGFAGSDRPAGLEYDLACQHRYLVGFMDAIGIQQAVLVGHSTGGAVVAAVAAGSGERVLGAVLIAPAGVPGCLSYHWPKNVLCRPGFVNRLGFRVANAAMFRRAFPFQLARQHLGLTGSFDCGHVGALRQVRSPMMLIWSTGDRRCLPKYADVYRHHVPSVDVRILPDEVGHMVPTVEPAATARLIADFVGQLGQDR